MRPHDVEVGQTYRVKVSQRDNPAQYLSGDPARAETDQLIFSWLLEAEDEFDLTVTSTGETLGDHPAVTGVRIAETSRVTMPLPTDLAEHLGLTPGVDYLVEGVLKDAVSGRIVSRPFGQTITIPVAWLRPL